MSIQDLVTIEDVQREIRTIVGELGAYQASEGAIRTYLGIVGLLGEDTYIKWPGESDEAVVVIVGLRNDGPIKVNISA